MSRSKTCSLCGSKLRFIEMAVKFLFTASPQVQSKSSDRNPSAAGLYCWAGISNVTQVHVINARNRFAFAAVNTGAEAAAAVSTATANPATASDTKAAAKTLLID